MKTNNNLISELVEKYANSFSNIEEKQTFISDWYFARAYVSSAAMMGKLCRTDNKPLNLVLEGTSSKMCAVLRELILRAHYIDFDEKSRENASTITLLYSNSKEEVKSTLLNTLFLGNYLHFLWEEPLKFLDVNVELRVKADGYIADVTEDMLLDFGTIYSETIDTRLAEKACQIYCVGDDLYNLPSIDTANVEQYELPLQVFETENYEYNRDKNWVHIGIKDRLSNVFCTDTFELRRRMLERMLKKEDVKEKTLAEMVRKNILSLSKCEHSRWVAEKLIMGFRPWTSAEHYKYDRLFKEDKKRFYNKLKKQEAHYNICSYQDLSRLEPQNMKFDTFLVLAMLEIMENPTKIDER